MNILTTVFLGDFGAKVWYPNSVLAIKPITNYYRSPDMTDMFEFYIAATTPAERIGRLKEAIGRYELNLCWVIFHTLKFKLFNEVCYYSHPAYHVIVYYINILIQ